MASLKSKSKECLRFKISDLFDNFYKVCDKNGIKVRVVVTDLNKMASNEIFVDFYSSFNIVENRHSLFHIEFHTKEILCADMLLERVYNEVKLDKKIRKRIPLVPHGYFDLDIAHTNENCEKSIIDSYSLSTTDLHISRKERKAVRQTKVFKHNGHEFKVNFFTTPTFCSHCTNFLWGLTNQGVECHICGLVAHKTCFEKIKGVCSLGVNNTLHYDNESLYRSHKFTRKQYWKLTFCDHDGTLIRGLIDQGFQCKQCHINVHPNCRAKVPHNCGLVCREDTEQVKREKIRQTQTNLIEKLKLKKSVGKEVSVYKGYICGKSFDFEHKIPFQTSNHRQIEDFQVEAYLGKGGFGSVYLVRDKLKLNDQLFAMKVFKKHKILLENDLDYTKTEFEVMIKASKCDFVTRLEFVFQNYDCLFFVMDFVPGGDLYGHILEAQKKRKVFDVERTRFYAAQIYLALRFLHSLEIVYRDIKPENILVCASGYLKLADFGMCKQGVNYTDKTTKTWCGTPEYMVPEILLRKEYNCMCDFWSFGILLTEMSTCQTPFYNALEAKLHENIITSEPELSGVVDRDLKDLISKLLDKNPNTRLGNPVSPHGKIQNHAFFMSKIAWNKLKNQSILAPFKPELSNQMDLNYFQSSSRTSSSLKMEQLNREDKALLSTIDQSCFSSFSYIRS